MTRTKVSEYVLRLIDDYLSNRWVICSYLDLPTGTSRQALAVCAAKDIGILELRINERLWWIKR